MTYIVDGVTSASSEPDLSSFTDAVLSAIKQALSVLIDLTNV